MRPFRLHAATFTIGTCLAALTAHPGALAADPPLPTRAPVHGELAQRKTAEPPPLDPVEQRAAKTLDVFERHCARCHDNTRLKRLLPAGGISNILDLQAIAGRRDLVRPGYPEASPLYVGMVTRHMPFDVFQEFAGGEEPTAGEIADVRAWIEGLPQTDACRQAVVRPADLAEMVRHDLESLDGVSRQGRRYLSLGDIVSHCDGNEALKSFTLAATKLLNLLSKSAEPLRLESVGADRLLLAFGLDEIGWSAEEWDWLAIRRPPALPALDVNDENAIQRVLPAAWLAYQAMDPGIYARLVGLPPNLADFRTAFGIDNATSSLAQTYELAESKATGGPRTLARFVQSDGTALWTAMDLKASGSGQSREEGKPALQTRAILSLPNGLPAFALYNRDGTPRRIVHASALPAEVAQAGAAGAGLNCLSCHGGGPAEFETANASEKAAPGAWQVNQDDAAYYYAARAAGLPPGFEIDGREPVIALAERHARNLGLEQAAVEVGVAPTKLADKLRGIDGTVRPAARRLLQGLVTRAEFEDLRREVVPKLQGNVSAATNSGVGDIRPGGRLRLSLWTERSGYATGEPLVLYAASNAPCRLTLISVDASDDAVVVFPNEFQEDNLLQPGGKLTVPGTESGFRLLVDEPGREVIIGICMAGERKNPPGILHDHELQPFTLLGDWKEHIQRSLEADSRERKEAGKKPGKKRTRRRGGRRIKSLPYRPDKRPLAQAWAVIVIPESKKETSASAPPATEEAGRGVLRESSPPGRPAFSE